MNGSDFRIFFENFAKIKLAEHLKISPGKIQHLSAINPISDYDLEYDDIRYDVKYANPTLSAKSKKIPTWDFSLRKVHNGKRAGQDYTHCDYFLLIGMKNGIPKRVFLVPVTDAPTNHIRVSISGYSRYHKYEIYGSR